MQEEKQIPRPETQVLIEDRPLDDFAPLDEQPAHVNGQLTDASGYKGGVVKRVWTPDEETPEVTYTLWIRTRVMKPSDYVKNQALANQIEIDNANLNRLRNEMASMKPDSRIERNQATIAKMSLDDEEFKDDETAYFDKKERLQGQIDQWLKEYADAHQRKQEQIQALLNKPTYYQIHRVGLFSRVLEDHTIGLPHEPGGPLIKVDFNSDDTKHELSEDFTFALQEYLWDVLKKEGRAAKKSAKQKKRP